MADYKFPPRQLVSASDQMMGAKPTIQRSTFHSTFNKLTTFDAAEIIPFLVDEVLPGDHLRYEATAFLRMATPLFPIFSSQRIDTHYFFVPNRLVWDNWKKFMGEQTNPSDSIAYTIPVYSAGNFASYTLEDYFGLPVGTHANDQPVSCLFARAYKLIYNEWFRDENLQTAITVSTGNGPDAPNDFPAQRAKTHDYFTSALPWPQKFTAPTVPLIGTAPVSGIGVSTLGATYAVAGSDVWDAAFGNVIYPFSATAHATIFAKGPSNIGGRPPEIMAQLDLGTAGFTINALREANAIQTLLERDARGGTRYIEMIKAQFGVSSPDARMQRPEYIGGGSTPLNVTPIAQTATGGGGLGTLGAAATAVGQHRASYAATEHGIIIGLISVKSEVQYQHALHKMFTRQTRYDFYFPPLADLGEQAILNSELYFSDNPTVDDAVYGYQERWHELRTRYSEITGAFRSGIAGTLDAWHLAQAFVAVPSLQAYIIDDPPMARILAAGATANNQQYFADIQVKRTATRPLPLHSTPSLGRF